MLAQVRGHSGDVAKHVYSVEQGYLEGITSLWLLRTRAMNLEWHQILDLCSKGAYDPPSCSSSKASRVCGRCTPGWFAVVRQALSRWECVWLQVWKSLSVAGVAQVDEPMPMGMDSAVVDAYEAGDLVQPSRAGMDENASFKTMRQREACEKVLVGRESFVYDTYRADGGGPSMANSGRGLPSALWCGNCNTKTEVVRQLEAWTHPVKDSTAPDASGMQMNKKDTGEASKLALGWVRHVARSMRGVLGDDRELHRATVSMRNHRLGMPSRFGLSSSRCQDAILCGHRKTSPDVTVYRVGKHYGGNVYSSGLDVLEERSALADKLTSKTQLWVSAAQPIDSLALIMLNGGNGLAVREKEPEYIGFSYTPLSYPLVDLVERTNPRPSYSNRAQRREAFGMEGNTPRSEICFATSDKNSADSSTGTGTNEATEGQFPSLRLFLREKEPKYTGFSYTPLSRPLVDLVERTILRPSYSNRIWSPTGDTVTGFPMLLPREAIQTGRERTRGGREREQGEGLGAAKVE
ncbi:hypothetical protein FB45DRAFT_999488 [Roridomyces roridus]|uniref:Uncharacterized protein n=1 Tax=Roridomyces roridus TaxID=1738132 RepID=A0AAD7CBI1_9AGAR|nr:hypothetical protein FB45DRAFT_999488 [Roridomyces roridus]